MKLETALAQLRAESVDCTGDETERLALLGGTALHDDTVFAAMPAEQTGHYRLLCMATPPGSHDDQMLFYRDDTTGGVTIDVLRDLLRSLIADVDAVAWQVELRPVQSYERHHSAFLGVLGLEGADDAPLSYVPLRVVARVNDLE